MLSNRNSKSIVCICVCSPSNIFRPLWIPWKDIVIAYSHHATVDVGSTLPLPRLFIFMSKLVCCLSLLSYYYRLYFGSSGTVLVVNGDGCLRFESIYPISHAVHKSTHFGFICNLNYEKSNEKNERRRKKTNHTHTHIPTIQSADRELTNRQWIW